jgi:CRISPR-associated endonuclease/helicase Cas3
MPTRFTSNSLAIDLEASVGQTGLYHSSAWQGHYREKSDGDEQQKKAEELHRMARLLATPVTVCTIDHLLLALTGTREEHHTIFYHLCNSCLVLDEADFYDPFVQSNIRLLLKVCHQFDVPVLIMSATVPDAAQSFYDIPKLQDVNESDSREKCRIINAGKAEGPDDIQHLLNEVSTADHKGVIVYANTVHRALAYHDWFRNNTSMETILYHSRFTERDKSRIEKKLLNNLGKTSQEAENENNGCIAVMTQIGEMSLNISAPVMVSDLCPYDRLAQRAGRLGRFNHSSVGTLHVVTPVKDGDLYPAPYGDFDNETSEWQPGEPLVKTNELLEFRPHSPQDFVRKVEEVYPTPEAFCSASSAATDNRERLKQHLEEEWLIVAPKQPDEDTGSTGEWQSRNIPPQVTVLTERPDSFESYAEYRHFVEFKGVSCPAYHVDIGKRLNRVQTVTFHMGDETETALYSSCYSLSEGLILDRDRKQPREDRIVE